MIWTSISFKRSSITCLDLLTGAHVMILILVKQCMEFSRMLILTPLHKKEDGLRSTPIKGNMLA